MKQKITYKMFVAIVLAGICFTTATAQTTTGNGKADSLLSKGVIGKDVYYQMKTSEAQPGSVSTATVVNTAVSAATVTASGKPQTAEVSPTPANDLEPMTIGQLVLKKKEAEARGLATDQYDKAIKEILTNQTK